MGCQCHQRHAALPSVSENPGELPSGAGTRRAGDLSLLIRITPAPKCMDAYAHTCAHIYSRLEHRHPWC